LEWVNWIDESIKKSDVHKIFYKTTVGCMTPSVWKEVTEHVKEWNLTYSNERNYQISITCRDDTQLCRLSIFKNSDISEQPKQNDTKQKTITTFKEYYLPDYIPFTLDFMNYELNFEEVDCKEKRPIKIKDIHNEKRISLGFQWGPIEGTITIKGDYKAPHLVVSHENNQKKSGSSFWRQQVEHNVCEIFTVDNEILRISIDLSRLD